MVPEPNDWEETACAETSSAGSTSSARATRATRKRRQANGWVMEHVFRSVYARTRSTSCFVPSGTTRLFPLLGATADLLVPRSSAELLSPHNRRAASGSAAMQAVRVAV